MSEWEAAVARTAAILQLPETPSIPYPASSSKSATLEPASTPAAKSKGKGKKRTKADADEEEAAKKAKTTEDESEGATATMTSGAGAGPGLSHDFLGMLDPESLRHPVLPSVDDMSKVLLEVRKNALRAEYGV